jgi:hypothetical protein
MIMTGVSAEATIVAERVLRDALPSDRRRLFSGLSESGGILRRI